MKLISIHKPPVFLQAPLIKMNIPTIAGELRRELKSKPRDIRYVIPSIVAYGMSSITYNGHGGILELEEWLKAIYPVVPTRVYLEYKHYIAVRTTLMNHIHYWMHNDDLTYTLVHPITYSTIFVAPHMGKGVFGSMV